MTESAGGSSTREQPARPEPVGLRTGRDVLRRAGVTALLVIAYWALQRVPLPFLAPDVLWIPLPSLLPSPIISVVNVGLAPVLIAFVAIELFALAVPALRRRRHGSAVERAGLTRAAWFLGMALVAVEAARTVNALSAAVGPEGAPFSGGRFQSVALALTLMAGTALVCSIALAIDRHGLGNGFAVLLAAQIIEQSVPVLLRLPEMSREAGVLVPLFLEGAALVIVLRLMRGDPRLSVRVAMPTCGLIPWVAAQWAMTSPPPMFVRSLVSLEAWDALSKFLEANRNTGEIVLSIGLALVFASLFSARRRISASWSAANLNALEPVAVSSATTLAHRVSVMLIAFGATLPFASEAFDNQLPWVVGVFGPAVVGATVMDAVMEARVRSRLGPLVSAFPLHRVYAVDPALEALAAAGIPAVARARYFRAVFHFFAPFAPIEILVPPGRAEEAAAICARVARPEKAASPAPEGELA